jgi:hypothetical protein
LGIKRAEVETEIKGASNMKHDIMELLQKTREGGSGSNVSHKIFQIFPSKTGPKRLFSNSHFETVSRWVLNLLLVQYEVNKADAVADFYNKLSAMPEAATIRGHLFKRQVLNHLRGISEERQFPIRRLTDSEEMTWYRGPVRHTDLEALSFFDEIAEAVRCGSPLHLVPLARNFPAVDSILYDPNDPDAVLTCIQITMNEAHPIAVSGLLRIQSWLDLDTPLAGLRPTTTRPWRFLFVVPSRMVSTFQSQTLKGDTDTCEWAGKVDQYVLGLKDETIFGRRSDSRVQHATTSQEGEQQVWR